MQGQGDFGCGISDLRNPGNASLSKSEIPIPKLVRLIFASHSRHCRFRLSVPPAFKIVKIVKSATIPILSILCICAIIGIIGTLARQDDSHHDDCRWQPTNCIQSVNTDGTRRCTTYIAFGMTNQGVSSRQSSRLGQLLGDGCGHRRRKPPQPQSTTNCATSPGAIRNLNQSYSYKGFRGCNSMTAGSTFADASNVLPNDPPAKSPENSSERAPGNSQIRQSAQLSEVTHESADESSDTTGSSTAILMTAKSRSNSKTTGRPLAPREARRSAGRDGSGMTSHSASTRSADPDTIPPVICHAGSCH